MAQKSRSLSIGSREPEQERCVAVLTQVEAVVSAVERDLGNPSVVIHNAVGGAFGTFREIDPSVEPQFSDQHDGPLVPWPFCPAMVTAGKGAILATGNTSALRGTPAFAGFAPTKAAAADSGRGDGTRWGRKAFTSPMSLSTL